jgi:hypothetical protein
LASHSPACQIWRWEKERESSPACAVLKPNWTARVSYRVLCCLVFPRLLRLLPQSRLHSNGDGDGEGGGERVIVNGDYLGLRNMMQQACRVGICGPCWRRTGPHPTGRQPAASLNGYVICRLSARRPSRKPHLTFDPAHGPRYRRRPGELYIGTCLGYGKCICYYLFCAWLFETLRVIIHFMRKSKSTCKVS